MSKKRDTWPKETKQLLYGVATRLKDALQSCEVLLGKLFYLMA